MKQLFYFFLLLYIYSINSQTVSAQNLQLKIKATDSVPESITASFTKDLLFNNYRSLKKYSDTLHYKLQNLGYIENEFISIQKKNDSSYIATFYFGKKYTTITIYYSKEDFSKEELLKVSKEVSDESFSIPISKIKHSLEILNTIKAKKGTPFAKLSLKNIQKNKNHTLKAYLTLKNKSKRTIDEIVIKGYDKFPKSYLKHYAGIKKGNLFDKEEITKQNNTLNSLGFITTTKPPEVLFKKEKTSVYLYLKKQKNNLFDGILGFSNNKDNNKLVLNGYLNLELNNNLNFGEQFLLNYKADGNDQQKFKVKLKTNYLLKSPIGLTAELNIFKKDTSFITTDQQINVNYQITPTTNSFVGYKSYNSSNLLKENTGQITIEDYKSKFFIAGGTYTKTQNNILFPLKTFINIFSEIGTRKTSSQNTAQIKANIDIQHIFNLNYRNSIYLRNNTNLLSSKDYLTNEVYRIGGVNSIRGFNENSIEATFYTFLNSEYRYQINQNIYTHTIIDIAYFENKLISTNKKLYSFGFGFGIKTNAGVLKIGIANGNIENQVFKFSNTKIHISISSQF